MSTEVGVYRLTTSARRLNWKGMAQNAGAGRNAAQPNVAEQQDDITRRIVALRVLGDVEVY